MSGFRQACGYCNHSCACDSLSSGFERTGTVFPGMPCSLTQGADVRIEILLLPVFECSMRGSVAAWMCCLRGDRVLVVFLNASVWVVRCPG